MSFESIIVAGTSCSGKSSIVNQLCKNNNNFRLVEAITTREKRDDDTNYEYVSEESFDKLLAHDELLINSEYRGKRYGIKKDAFNYVLKMKAVPILLITAESACRLIDTEAKYMFFFVDASDSDLLDRLDSRQKGQVTKAEKKAFKLQNEKDRAYSNSAHYIIQNNNVDSAVSLILLMWENRNRCGGLSKRIITELISNGILLDDADLDNISGASYDLRLGDQYYYGGRIKHLSSSQPVLTIEPYDYAIVSCKESARIPRDVIAKFGLTVGLFCQGIILSNGPQIDPGFRGTLFCLLFNTSNKPVSIKRGQHYATIEFNKLIEPAPPYDGKYQGCQSIIDYIPPNAMQGAINELKREIEGLKKESRIMQNIYLGVASLMFAIIAILLVIN